MTPSRNSLAPPTAERGTERLEPAPPHPANMTPRQRHRRGRLIEAALALLEIEDYERVSVKEIADRADVSLQTLYNYFSSKERLFAEVLVHWADNLRTDVRSRPLKSTSPADRLGEAVHRALRAFERRPQMARLVNVLITSTDPFSGELVRRLDRSTTDAYMLALDGVDPTLARRMVDVVNAVFSIELREWSQGRISMREVHDRLDSAIGIVVRG